MTDNERKELSLLRKAMLPVLRTLQKEVLEANDKRFELLEKMVSEIAAKELSVNVAPPVVEAPIVKYTAPEITVTTDLSKLEEMLKAAVERELPQPIIKNETSINTPDYRPHDQSGGAIKYNGFVSPDGSWYIQRISKNQQRYAKGKGSYGDAWEKRGKLEYGYIDA